MSRSDPQFNLRIPEALRDQVMAAAKESGRSATAEILARLELSMLADSNSPDDLLPAEKAKAYASLARKNVPAQVRERIRRAINNSVIRGLPNAQVDLKDFGLESLPTEELAKIHIGLSQELKDAGYLFEWDGGESIWIVYGDPEPIEDMPGADLTPKQETATVEPVRRMNLKRTKRNA